MEMFPFVILYGVAVLSRSAARSGLKPNIYYFCSTNGSDDQNWRNALSVKRIQGQLRNKIQKFHSTVSSTPNGMTKKSRQSHSYQLIQKLFKS